MRATSREQQIIELLKREPLISQEELARRLGITRSSAAVHISNLMKKGIILGRGYVFNDRASSVVVGTSEVQTLVRGGGGQGPRIDHRFGGFGYGVSCALARFGMDVKVVTVVGGDREGAQLLEAMKGQRVDTTHVLHLPEERSERVVRVVRQEGETVYREGHGREVFVRLVEARSWLVWNCEWLVVAPELQATVSGGVPRSLEHPPALCTMVKGGMEAVEPELLSRFSLVVAGAREDEFEQWSARGPELVERGAGTLVLTDGATLVRVMSPAGSVEVTLSPNQGFDLEEHLEHFLAGMVYGLSQGLPHRQAIRIGCGIASVAGGVRA
ncbi:MAG: PfkB family carbohydrate kinase [Syntrophomonadaceae bacterium]|nr:PfkB family carbohydrate kinase [Syntrophomonadaceae bacterium]MDH7497409.1 PfkB family carbohydrate kinase [Syntrophomonadaceae bacterium]